MWNDEKARSKWRTKNESTLILPLVRDNTMQQSFAVLAPCHIFVLASLLLMRGNQCLPFMYQIERVECESDTCSRLALVNDWSFVNRLAYFCHTPCSWKGDLSQYCAVQYLHYGLDDVNLVINQIFWLYMFFNWKFLSIKK